MRVSKYPTIIVWTLALFSSSIRSDASMSGQWIAGWFQAAIFYLPFVAGIIGNIA